MISKDIQLACKYKVPNQDELKAKLSSQTGILRWNWQEWTHSYALALIKVQAKRLFRVEKKRFYFWEGDDTLSISIEN